MTTDAPRTFTAAEVRRVAEALRQYAVDSTRGFVGVTPDVTLGVGDESVSVVALLDAYAARLEQDERNAAILDGVPTETPCETADALREEGRREIYLAIMTDLPIGAFDRDDDCLFCWHHKGAEPYTTHKPTCLWLRAQEAMKA